MNPVPPLEPELQRRVYGEVSALLDLDMGLLFFDTTNIYFRRDEEERPEDGGKAFCNCKYSVNPAPGCDLGLDTFSGLW